MVFVKAVNRALNRLERRVYLNTRTVCYVMRMFSAILSHDLLTAINLAVLFKFSIMIMRSRTGSRHVE